jgi:fumarate reductase subunit C
VLAFPKGKEEDMSPFWSWWNKSPSVLGYIVIWAVVLFVFWFSVAAVLS